MNRIQLIFNEKWAMAREDYYNLVSLILPSIHSGNFKEVEAFFEKDTVTAYASDLNFVGRWNLEDSGLPSDSVAVIVLEGTLYAWETSAFRNILHRRQLMTVLQASFCG